MEIKELYQLIEDFYGYKADMRYMNTEEKKVGYFLYDAFSVVCEIDGQYGCFGAGIVMPDGQMLIAPLGKEISLNSDPDSIRKSLKTIDEYCRLRLPDKYLEAYEKAYNK